MALFNGVPYITETPAESMRAAAASGARAGQIFGSAFESARQSSRRKAELAVTEKLGQEANDIRRKAEAANLRINLARWEDRKRMMTSVERESQRALIEAPYLSDFMATVQGVTSFEEAAALTPHPGLTGERFSQAISVITQKRLAMAELAKQRFEADLAAKRAEYQLKVLEAKRRLNPLLLQSLEAKEKIIAAGVNPYDSNTQAAALKQIDDLYGSLLSTMPDTGTNALPKLDVTVPGGGGSTNAWDVFNEKFRKKAP